MATHKDLPSGAQQWARDVDGALAEVRHLREVVQHLTKVTGVDYSNPKRGLSQAAAPSINKAVNLKLADLFDVNAGKRQPGDVLTWDADEQKIVFRAIPGGGGGGGKSALNLFPNPDLSTVDGGMARHFTEGGDGNFTVLSVGGNNVLRSGTDGSSTTYDWAAPDLDAFGLEAGTSYVLSFTMNVSNPSPDIKQLYGWVSGITWSTGHLIAPLPGSSRFYVPFRYQAGFGAEIDTEYRIGGAGHIDFDRFMLCESTVVHESDSNVQPGATIDLIGKGCIPGVPYILYAESLNVGVGDLSTVKVVAGGNTIAEISSQSETLAGAVCATFVIPAGVTTVEVVFTTDSASGEWRNVSVIEAPIDYFDGDTPNDAQYTYAWTGTPHDSPSTRTPK